MALRLEQCTVAMCDHEPRSSFCSILHNRLDRQHTVFVHKQRTQYSLRGVGTAFFIEFPYLNKAEIALIGVSRPLEERRPIFLGIESPYTVPALSGETLNRTQADVLVLGARESTYSRVALSYCRPPIRSFSSSTHALPYTGLPLV